MASHVREDAPKIKEVTDEELKLPQADKIKLINDEIKSLQKYCTGLGLSKKEVNLSTKPIRDVAWSQKTKGRLRFLFYIAIIAAICSVGYRQPRVRKLCHFWGRKAQVSILGLWDWTVLYDNDCFVANPYFISESEAVTEDDCKLCKNYTAKKVRNITSKSLNRYFLTKDRPVVVVNATNDWSAHEKFSVQFIRELYSTSSALKEATPCTFRSSNENVKTLKDIWEYIDDNEYVDAFWENCEGAPAKAIRGYYNRLELLPLACESASTNWIYLTKGKNDGHQVLLDEFKATGIIVTQVVGQGEIELDPPEVCGSTCEKQVIKLKPGQAAIFTNRLWLLAYRPISETETVGILTTYHQNIF